MYLLTWLRINCLHSTINHPCPKTAMLESFLAFLSRPFPVPPATTAFDLAATVENAMRCLALRSASTLRLTGAPVRCRGRASAFSSSQGCGALVGLAFVLKVTYFCRFLSFALPRFLLT